MFYMPHEKILLKIVKTWWIVGRNDSGCVSIPCQSGSGTGIPREWRMLEAGPAASG